MSSVLYRLTAGGFQRRLVHGLMSEHACYRFRIPLFAGARLLRLYLVNPFVVIRLLLLRLPPRLIYWQFLCKHHKGDMPA